MTAPNLIMCGDHKMAPWSIVCVHLVDGSSREWMPIDSTFPEVDFDWVCPDCYSTITEPDISRLKAICIHCVRYLRQKYDPNFEDDEDVQ